MNNISNIIKKLPYWFHAKHICADSTTKDFLSVFGDLLNEVESNIKLAYDMCNLETFNNKDYVIHKCFIESFEYMYINNIRPTQYLNEIEFVNSVDQIYHGYYHDTEHGILYLSNISKDDIIVIDNNEYNSKLIEHRVWNADIIDEYGLLFDMPRLKNENNLSYKNRLLEYSKTLAKSTYHGMSSYIGHYTGKYKIIEWVDSSNDIKITHSNVCSYVYVDDKPFFNFRKNDDNTIVLYGDIEDKGITRKIKYFYGFDINSLIEYSKYDITHYSNFVPKENFSKLFDEISVKCPIMWGTARWDEHYWLQDIKNDEYIFISPTFDPDISILKDK